jgi:Zn-dependent protease
MRQTLRLGRVAGIPVGAHWSALAIVILLAWTLADAVLPSVVPGHTQGVYWSVAVLGAFALLGCLLLHEMAHALVAQHYGMSVRRVTLWLLGGVAELEGDPPSARADLAVAAAGPAASLAAGAASGLLAALSGALGLPGLVSGTLAWLAVVNVVLAVFNLLPGAPLDGGRVLRALLWRHFGDRRRAALVATRSGHVVGLALVGLGLAQVLFTGSLGGLWLALIGWFMISAAGAEGAVAAVQAGLAGRRAVEVMTPEPVTGLDTQTIADFAATVVPRCRHRVFPVCDAFGRPVGTVSLAALAGRAPDTPLGAVCTPAARIPAVGPMDDLGQAVTRLAPGAGVVLVVDAGVLVGIITRTDLQRAVELAELRGASLTGPRYP